MERHLRLPPHKVSLQEPIDHMHAESLTADILSKYASRQKVDKSLGDIALHPLEYQIQASFWRAEGSPDFERLYVAIGGYLSSRCKVRTVSFIWLIPYFAVQMPGRQLRRTTICGQRPYEQDALPSGSVIEPSMRMQAW